MNVASLNQSYCVRHSVLANQDIGDNAAVQQLSIDGIADELQRRAGQIHAHHARAAQRNRRIEGGEGDEISGLVCCGRFDCMVARFRDLFRLNLRLHRRLCDSWCLRLPRAFRHNALRLKRGCPTFASFGRTLTSGIARFAAAGATTFAVSDCRDAAAANTQRSQHMPQAPPPPLPAGAIAVANDDERTHCSTSRRVQETPRAMPPPFRVAPPTMHLFADSSHAPHSLHSRLQHRSRAMQPRRHRPLRTIEDHRCLGITHLFQITQDQRLAICRRQRQHRLVQQLKPLAPIELPSTSASMLNAGSSLSSSSSSGTSRKLADISRRITLRAMPNR